MQIRMLVVQGKDRGKTLRFPTGEFLFGRGSECHVQPNSPSVSRQHCILCVSSTEIRIRDLGSTNGTLVNGNRVAGERRLLTGDRLQFGPLVLQVLDDRPLPSTSGETVSDAAGQIDTNVITSLSNLEQAPRTDRRHRRKTNLNLS